MQNNQFSRLSSASINKQRSSIEVYDTTLAIEHLKANHVEASKIVKTASPVPKGESLRGSDQKHLSALEMQVNDRSPDFQNFTSDDDACWAQLMEVIGSDHDAIQMIDSMEQLQQQQPSHVAPSHRVDMRGNSIDSYHRYDSSLPSYTWTKPAPSNFGHSIESQSKSGYKPEETIYQVNFRPLKGLSNEVYQAEPLPQRVPESPPIRTLMFSSSGTLHEEFHNGTDTWFDQDNCHSRVPHVNSSHLLTSVPPPPSVTFHSRGKDVKALQEHHNSQQIENTPHPELVQSACMTSPAPVTVVTSFKSQDPHLELFSDSAHPADSHLKQTYTDYSKVPDHEQALPPEERNTGGVVAPFPLRLHDMLFQNKFPDIISWAPHGRSFFVHKPKEFQSKVLCKYFNQTKYRSFQRQLNLYGFRRITREADRGGYYHELFLRNRRKLCTRMKRKAVKGPVYRPIFEPELEPDFYSMPPLEGGPTPTAIAPAVLENHLHQT